MKTENSPQTLMPLSIVLIPFLCLFGSESAYAMVSETWYSTSLSEMSGVVRIIVAVFGGLIGVLGVVVAFRGVGGTADVSMSVSEHKNLSMKRISQGVGITLIGAGILVGTLY